jgi:hypothetical protein
MNICSKLQLLVAGAVTLASAVPASGQQVTFTRIAETWTGSFWSLGLPRIDSGNVAFTAQEQLGDDFSLYASIGGTINVLVEAGVTPMPGGLGTFSGLSLNFDLFSFDDGTVAFYHAGPVLAPDRQQWGIYAAGMDGSLNIVVDQDTMVPARGIRLVVSPDHGSTKATLLSMAHSANPTTTLAALLQTVGSIRSSTIHLSLWRTGILPFPEERETFSTSIVRQYWKGMR